MQRNNNEIIQKTDTICSWMCILIKIILSKLNEYNISLSCFQYIGMSFFLFHFLIVFLFYVVLKVLKVHAK